MYEIKDLQERFSWSYMQTRDRVKWLQENFSDEVKVGKNQKYLVTENGFSMLDRLHQLEEKDQLSLGEALKQVKVEMEENQEESGSEKDSESVKSQSNTSQNDTNHPGNGSQNNLKYVKQLERENEFLREQLRARDQQIQQLLPGKRKSPISRFWEWLGL